MLRDLVHSIRRKLAPVTVEAKPGPHARSGGNGQARAPLRPYVAEMGFDQSDYFRQVGENYAALTNGFQYYRALVDGLRDLKRPSVVPVGDLLDNDAGAGAGPAIALRHDIDADPEAAVRCARYLARTGVAGSFYLLHTALYYGVLRRGTFIRNPSLVQWVQELIVAGCEIGVHNDAFGAIQLFGLDGAQALVEEIRWLRSLGARIEGTVGHNSAPVYGAENSEIFSGRVLWRRSASGRDGRPLPLGALSERELDLRYEGTYLLPKPNVDAAAAASFCAADPASGGVRSERWMREYLLDNPCGRWACDLQAWLIGRDQWVIAGRPHGERVFEWMVSLGRVLEAAASLPPGCRVLIVVHPEYVRG